MPKKTHNRSFTEWFFGTHKQQKKKTAKRAPTRTKKSSAPEPVANTPKSLHSHIDDALNQLPDTLARRISEATPDETSHAEHMHIERTKRKHLQIGVVSFMVLIVAVWGWSTLASLGYFGSLTTDSFSSFKNLTTSISEGVSQELEE